MAKRKQQQDVDMDEDSDSDVSLINVDFEFFDPNPEIDYHAIRNLLSQLFHSSSPSLHLEALTDLILGQPLVGTTVKMDGREGDPYAFLTVLNMAVHKDHPSIQALTSLLLSKSQPTNPSFHTTLQNILGPNANPSQHIGLVLSERLINMPVQIVPHMYRMLVDEIKWAIDDNEPYTFTHLLFISRTYTLTQDEAQLLLSSQPNASSRKNKSKKLRPSLPSGAEGGGVFSFHPEDEVIEKYASQTYTFSTPTSTPRTAEDFGLELGTKVMLVPADKFEGLVRELGEVYVVGG
ncbi:hypothetical protein JAAARDRAFT_137838 [Jaapia argillacea MUCL 33604]|uniref:Protein BCP1 n=1 Tax=Jaapia argillacea MUCL 33604 TaxID=933084 RepID=A0A067PNZ5_9AGAM|nr:hypothetical protein JAAARDRAFT_137838 [Jaapia argillacea MUCL 33604]